jgi:hypothetical protein
MQTLSWSTVVDVFVVDDDACCPADIVVTTVNQCIDRAAKIRFVKNSK